MEAGLHGLARNDLKPLFCTRRRGRGAATDPNESAAHLTDPTAMQCAQPRPSACLPWSRCQAVSPYGARTSCAKARGARARAQQTGQAAAKLTPTNAGTLTASNLEKQGGGGWFVSEAVHNRGGACAPCAPAPVPRPAQQMNCLAAGRCIWYTLLWLLSVLAAARALLLLLTPPVRAAPPRSGRDRLPPRRSAPAGRLPSCHAGLHGPYKTLPLAPQASD